jgi:hypothetical protein
VFSLFRSTMTEQPTTEAPIMLRADITKAELVMLKVAAINERKTVQAYLADLIREKIGATP